MNRVVLDLERLKFPYSGLGQFCQHFGNSIIQEAAQFGIEPIVLARRASRHVLAEPVNYAWADWWRKESFASVFQWLAWRKPEDVSLWHTTHHQSKFWPSDPSIPVLLTIHDLKFVQMSSPAEIERKLLRLQRVVDRVAGVATISQAVKLDIEAHLQLRGKPIRVIYNGVYPTGSIAPKRPATVCNRPFLFSIGLFERKKNFHTLVEMLEYLPDYHLVLAGDYRTSYGRFVRSQVDKLRHRDRIVFLGTIGDSERQWLYENCTAFMFPSMAEGFGLPVLEAMSAGRPAVLSRCTSLPEVGGEVASYWDSFEPIHMAQRVRECLARFANEADLSRRLVEHSERFSWTKAAREYLALYRELLETNPATGTCRAA